VLNRQFIANTSLFLKIARKSGTNQWPMEFRNGVGSLMLRSVSEANKNGKQYHRTASVHQYFITNWARAIVMQQ
jgi:hypothetical protein